MKGMAEGGNKKISDPATRVKCGGVGRIFTFSAGIAL